MDTVLLSAILTGVAVFSRRLAAEQKPQNGCV